MQKTLYKIIAVLTLALMFSCLNNSSNKNQIPTEKLPEGFEKYGQEFKGKIAESYEDSEQWWPKKKEKTKKRFAKRNYIFIR